MQRVRITFDRNQDSITQQYLVYRALGPNEPVLAYIIEQPEDVNPIQVINDVLQKVQDIYYMSHGNIIESRAIEVRVDSTPVIPVMVDYRNGSVRLDPVPDPGSTVTASYWFDGIEFVDTSRVVPGVTRMAPPAVDRNPPRSVQNLTIGLDPATKLARISFEQPPATSGTIYRYFVVSGDTRGNRSWPSSEVSVTLNQSIGEVPYIVQRSIDGGVTWKNFVETKELFVLDIPQFNGPMKPVTGLSAQIIPADGKVGGRVRLTWSQPAADTGTTYMYRVITRSALNALSDPSAAAGPEEVPRVAVKYIVTRADESNTAVLGETAEQAFTDEAAIAYMIYTYYVYAVDAAGNISEATAITVDTTDLVPPEAPEIVGVDVS